MTTTSRLTIVDDTRFLGDCNLQVSYRVEFDGQTLGFIRYVNHGSQRYVGVSETLVDGKRVCCAATTRKGAAKLLLKFSGLNDAAAPVVVDRVHALTADLTRSCRINVVIIRSDGLTSSATVDSWLSFCRFVLDVSDGLWARKTGIARVFGCEEGHGVEERTVAECRQIVEAVTL